MQGRRDVAGVRHVGVGRQRHGTLEHVLSTPCIRNVSNESLLAALAALQPNQEYAMAGQGANGMSAEFSVHTVEQAMEFVASEELANGMVRHARGPPAGLWLGYQATSNGTLTATQLMSCSVATNRAPAPE